MHAFVPDTNTITKHMVTVGIATPQELLVLTITQVRSEVILVPIASVQRQIALGARTMVSTMRQLHVIVTLIMIKPIMKNSICAVHHL